VQPAGVCLFCSVGGDQILFCSRYLLSVFSPDVIRCCFSAANLPFLIFIRVIQITKMKIHIIDRKNNAA